MPSCKGGYYRRNRGFLEYWFRESDYAEGKEKDGAIAVDVFTFSPAEGYKSAWDIVRNYLSNQRKDSCPTVNANADGHGVEQEHVGTPTGVH